MLEKILNYKQISLTKNMKNNNQEDMEMSSLLIALLILAITAFTVWLTK